MNTNLGCVIAVALLSSSAVSFSETIKQDTASITGVVEAFHKALASGDAKAAMDLLAPDAMILESGSAQTRAEYDRDHLKEDIAFVREVPSTRSILSVQREGNAAWLISTSLTKGSVHGRAVSSAGTELMVLSKSSAGWRIRAIHWSSHSNGKPE